MPTAEKFLPPTQYNSARILTRLAQLITAQGGKVKPLYSAVISDRNLEEACTATQRRIESSSTFHLKVREPLISNLQKELALFQSIPNAPITVTHTSYINFAMNGVYYYYELDDNPFFPFHYIKAPIDPKSETYSGDACMEESSKSWFTDPLIGFGCPDSEIESAAEAILSLLLAAPLSTIRHDTFRTRIPNAYDSGYHFENIPVKERRIKIDF